MTQREKKERERQRERERERERARERERERERALGHNDSACALLVEEIVHKTFCMQQCIDELVVENMQPTAYALTQIATRTPQRPLRAHSTQIARSTRSAEHHRLQSPITTTFRPTEVSKSERARADAVRRGRRTNKGQHIAECGQSGSSFRGRCGALWGALGRRGGSCAWGAVRSCGELWGAVGSCGELRGAAGAVGSCGGVVGSCGELWGAVGSCGELRGAAGAVGSCGGVVGSCGELWGAVGSCGELWAGMYRDTHTVDKSTRSAQHAAAVVARSCPCFSARQRVSVLLNASQRSPTPR